MQQINSLKNHLLIAMPQLDGGWFEGTVTYLCEHSDEGAMGLVLNRPSNIAFEEICEQLELNRLPQVTPEIYLGGPVTPEHGFILHQPSGQWDSSINVTQDVQLTSSQDILKAIATGSGPRHFRMTLGYAGWSQGQLDQELRDNAWLTLEANVEMLFHTDTDALYQTALNALGVDKHFLSQEGGRA